MNSMKLVKKIDMVIFNLETEIAQLEEIQQTLMKVRD
jgi:hypothetical protein